MGSDGKKVKLSKKRHIMRKVSIGINGLKTNVDHTPHIEMAYSAIQRRFSCSGLKINTNGNNQGHIEISFNANDGTDDEILKAFTSALRQYDEDAYAFII